LARFGQSLPTGKADITRDPAQSATLKRAPSFEAELIEWARMSRAQRHAAEALAIGAEAPSEANLAPQPPRMFGDTSKDFLTNLGAHTSAHSVRPDGMCDPVPHLSTL